MSEYTISCDKCGMYLGCFHASEWSSNILCSKCWNEENLNQELLNKKTQKQ